MNKQTKIISLSWNEDKPQSVYYTVPADLDNKVIKRASEIALLFGENECSIFETIIQNTNNEITPFNLKIVDFGFNTCDIRNDLLTFLDDVENDNTSVYENLFSEDNKFSQKVFDFVLDNKKLEANS